jgi:hypothetical protein
MNVSPASSLINTFVVRIWLEWSESGSSWRGQIMHVQSDHRMAFLSLQDMLQFMQGYVAMEFQNQPTVEKEVSKKNIA